MTNLAIKMPPKLKKLPTQIKTFLERDILANKHDGIIDKNRELLSQRVNPLELIRGLDKLSTEVSGETSKLDKIKSELIGLKKKIEIIDITIHKILDESRNVTKEKLRFYKNLSYVGYIKNDSQPTEIIINELDENQSKAISYTGVMTALNLILNSSDKKTLLANRISLGLFFKAEYKQHKEVNNIFKVAEFAMNSLSTRKTFIATEAKEAIVCDLVYDQFKQNRFATNWLNSLAKTGLTLEQ